MPRPHRPGVRDGVGGRRGHRPGSGRVRRGQVRGAVRSARRLVQHRRQLPVGTIFSSIARISMEGRGTAADVLQPGCRQVAAGYVMYGSSTMLVYTTGQGVHGFTLDPSIGEFLLSHPRIVTPRRRHLLQREREQLRPVGQGGADRGARTQGRSARRHEAQEQPVHRLARRRFPPQPDRRRRSFSIRRTRRIPRASCACSTRRVRWPSSPSRRRGAPPTASIASSTSFHRTLHQRTPLVIGSREDVGFVADAIRHAQAPCQRRHRRSAHRVKHVYGPSDWAGDPARDLGAPGEFPFTRGV